MATLQKIRNTGPFLVIIVGLALLAFILGDLFTSGSTLVGKRRDRAFVVNGNVVTTQEYADKITEFENFQKMVSGQTSLDENVSLQIREAVYQQMVREELLGSQSEKLGLTVTKAEVNDLVHGESISPILQQLPFFLDPQTGAFSRDVLVEFLGVLNTPSPSPQEQALVDQYKSLWLFIENMVKSQRLEEKYVSLLSNAIMVNDVEAQNAFKTSKQNADVAYAMKSYFTVPDSTVTLTDKEIRDYYNANQDLYKLDAPLVKISYFAKEIAPSEADIAEFKAQSDKAYEEMQNSKDISTIVADYSDMPFRDVYMSEHAYTPSQLDFIRTASVGDIKEPVMENGAFQLYKLVDKKMAPDSVHLSMMAIPNSNVMGQDSVVTNFVDSLYNVINGGETFASVANNLNPNSNGGDVGWAREVDLLPFGSDLVNEVFSAPVGKPMRISTQGQEIIYQVEDKTAPVNKYKLAVINIPVLASEKTSNNVDNELNQFVSNPDSKSKFNELASEAGYMVMPSMTFSANDFSLGQIPNSRQVITWAANEKNKGAVKKFDLTNLRVVARVDEVIPAGIAPLSEVVENIRMTLMNQKKAEAIIADLESKNLTTIDAYASAMNATSDTVKYVNFGTQNITGLGFEPVINAVASYAPANKVVGPMQGNMGVYVANVVDRTESEGTYDAAQQKATMMNSNAYRIQMQAIEQLKRELKVEDNRYKFF
ncbi:MAG: peptidylprolyl isomerase [Fermentimonas sp.]|jgi:peptidyl-prolyl cis-trans isomerase D